MSLPVVGRLVARLREAGMDPGRRAGLTRVLIVVVALAALFAAYSVWSFLGGGRRSGPGTSGVVLYTSVDDVLLPGILDEFRKATGIEVRVVTDTEATKTTGLVQRLIAEKDRPRADVWWSSEPIGTIRLARAGLLEAFTTAAERDFAGGWPAGRRGSDQTWYGMAERGRVIAYHTQRVAEAQAPRRLRDLTDPAWKDRVGMARPQFGTTRAHMAAVAARAGPEALRRWLGAMRENGVRLYDGNASVVRAIAQGEIDVGLTDTDDVWAGQREGWPVAFVPEAIDTEVEARAAAGIGALPSVGPLMLPCTVARVRGGPSPLPAKRLIDFLLSERVERLLAESDSRNVPIRPGLAAEFARNAVGPTVRTDFEKVADSTEEAMRIVESVLGGR